MRQRALVSLIFFFRFVSVLKKGRRTKYDFIYSDLVTLHQKQTLTLNKTGESLLDGGLVKKLKHKASCE